MIAGGLSESSGLLSASAVAGSISASTALLDGETVTTGASAAFVVHGTGAGTIDLPASGGRILVDLVVTTDGSVQAFTGTPAVDQGGAVSVVSSDWTAKGNILMSTAMVETAGSGYAVDLMDWYVVGKSGSATVGTGSTQAATVDPSQILALVGDLGALAGPISKPRSNLFATSVPLSLVARQPFGPGSTVVATLALDVAGESGVYHLSLVDGQCAVSESVTRSLVAGAALEIRVGE